MNPKNVSLQVLSPCPTATVSGGRANQEPGGAAGALSGPPFEGFACASVCGRSVGAAGAAVKGAAGGGAGTAVEGAGAEGVGGALVSPAGVAGGGGGSGCWFASAGVRKPSSSATDAAAIKDLSA